MRLQLRIAGGYEELSCSPPASSRRAATRCAGSAAAVVGPGDRLALLSDRIDELSLQPPRRRRPSDSAARLVRPADRPPQGRADRRRALSRVGGALDADAEPTPSSSVSSRPSTPITSGCSPRPAPATRAGCCSTPRRARGAGGGPPAFDHVLIDDAQELDRSRRRSRSRSGRRRSPWPATPTRRCAGSAARAPSGWTDSPRCRHARRRARRQRPLPAAGMARGGAALGRGRRAGARRAAGWSRRPPAPASRAVAVLQRAGRGPGGRGRDRAADRAGRTDPARIAVIVPDVTLEGQAVAVALEERAIAHRVIGEAAFFRRAEIRDVLAWLRLLSRSDRRRGGRPRARAAAGRAALGRHRALHPDRAPAQARHGRGDGGRDWSRRRSHPRRGIASARSCRCTAARWPRSTRRGRTSTCTA